ncbi:MAG: hypothetical protein AXA67_09430 [Methylothermaceae bacteria B42]|nr:MAG: hypothetical protein AXA67_09430 [Methylothermaceae bacteria B42]
MRQLKIERVNPDISPAGFGPSCNQLIFIYKMLKFHDFQEIQLGFSPNPIPALACPGTPGLGLPSSHSYGYAFQSSPAPRRTCPAPSSGMLVKYPG